MAKVSIIVPVYQVENYIRQCIDSILNQTFRDFELILVDDGSRDNSGAICDEYARRDARIRVLHTENRGPGMARNTAMGISTGEYLMFLDSDDLLDGENSLSILLNCIEKTGADIAVGNYRRFSDQGLEAVSGHGLSNCEDSKSAAFRYRGFYLTGHLAFNWGKLYRKSFLLENRLYFQDFRLAEDKLYNICCYACQPRYAFVEQSVVQYRRTENSLTTRSDPQFSEKWVLLAERFEAFLREKEIHENYYDLTAFHMFYGSFFIVEQGVRRADSFSGIVRRLRQYGKEDAVKKAMTHLAKGNDLSEIPSAGRRFITWGASMAFSLRAYAVFTAATMAFVKTQY